MRPIASCSRRRGVPKQPYNVSSAWPGLSGWFVVFCGLATTLDEDRATIWRIVDVKSLVSTIFGGCRERTNHPNARGKCCAPPLLRGSMHSSLGQST